MPTGQDYNFNVVPKPRVPRPPSAGDPRPDVLPTPSVDYQVSKPAFAVVN